MKKKHIITVVLIVFIIMVIAVFLAVGGMAAAYLSYRNHWGVSAELLHDGFKESDKELHNPNRGFYSMYGFAINNHDENYYRQLADKMYKDRHALSLIQINLRNYKDGPITDEGLSNIEDLFQALEAQDRQYIIRFLYDWNGKADETEPEDIQIILGHMRQLKDIFHGYSGIIFTFQGIFVGDCGEMHGSQHMSEESMVLLMKQFLEVTSEESFLSVRTPEHWRTLTGISEAEEFGLSELSKRLGLYNDGMMGTELDTGTYGTGSKTEAGPFNKWSRDEELAFQSELCKLVPNGGEVIIENPVNDFENAIERLKTMHVTYLNRDYDQNVLNKWAESIVTEEGVFYGMDGLTYVDRHLGYRLFIADAVLEYEFWQDKLSVEIGLKNEGFAPMYREPEKNLVVRNTATGEMQIYPVNGAIRTLAGGNDSDEILIIDKEISLAGLTAGEYEVYFYIRDTDSGCYIELANQQEMTELGYRIGSFKIEELINPFTGERLELGSRIGETFKRITDGRKEEGNVQ